MSRPICPKCFQLSLKCICSSIIELNSPIKIHIIRDKKEKKHPFNTVNLLALNLKNIQIIDIDPDEFNDSIYLKLIGSSANLYLLFPNENSTELISNSEFNEQIELIVLDGTWNKTKKIFFQSPYLQSLPSFQLSIKHPSQYQIRKSSLEYSLSTIEAVTLTLNTLSNRNFNDLLKPFHRLIEIQLELEKNGKKKGSD